MATKKTTSTRRTATKKPTVKRTAQKRSKKVETKSFRLSKSDTPFMTFRIDKQTFYWLVLGFVVIIFSLWLAKLQSDIQVIFDQIEASNDPNYVLVQPKETK